MRILVLTLVLACLCSLVPCSAADYQPTADEWRELIRMAETAKSNYASLVKETEEQIERAKKTEPVSPIAGHPILVPDLKALEALLARAKKTESNLATLLVEMKALTEATRTREKYLHYLRPVKQATYQYPLDRSQPLFHVNSLGMSSVDYGPASEGQQGYIPPAPLPVGVPLTWQNFPRLDGSTTAQPLSTLLACRLLGLGAQWHVRRNSANMSERFLIPVCGEPPRPDPPGIVNYAPLPGLRAEMVHTGTGSAYRNLIEGRADLILVARAPSPDELALAKQRKVELTLTPVGYDAFVFLLHTKNPVNSLTVKQIQDIYTDNIINWSEVDGPLARVVAFQRERNSGSQETMESLVMKGLQMAQPLEKTVGYGMGGPYSLLPQQEHGISYTFYYYHTMQSPEGRTRLGSRNAPSLKMCAVNGVTPTPDTIRDKTYPFVTDVYAMVRTDTPKDSSAIHLRDWLLTPEGQAVVKESGYVELGQ